MSVPRSEVFEAINSERSYQDALWPQGAEPMTIGEEILVLGEYVMKARSAWTTESRPEINALHIIRKISGIATRCMEQHGAPLRKV